MMPAKQKYLDIYMTASNIYLTSNENSYNYRPSQKQAAYYPTKYFLGCSNEEDDPKGEEDPEGGPPNGGRHEPDGRRP